MNPNSSRGTFLIAVAFAIVFGCLAFTVYMQVDDDFAKATVTLLLGRFLGYLDSAYQFEFGTTRSSRTKDETITELTKTAGVVANTAAGTTPGKPDEVTIEAKTATVNVETSLKGNP